MLNQWLSVLSQAAPGVVLGYAMDIMQQVKPDRSKRWERIAFWMAACFIMAVNKIFTNGSVMGTVIGTALMIVALAISFKFFYAGSFWRKAMISAMLIVAVTAAECAFALMCWLYHTDTLSMDFRQPDMMLGCLVGSVFSIVSLFFVVTLWKRFENQGRMPGGSWVFVLIPLCLLIPSVQYYVVIMQSGGKAPFIHLVSMLATLVLDVLLVFVEFNQAEKEDLEKELRELKYRSQLEQQHYRNIEARREELAKIRHDYNNLLTTVLGLLDMGKTQEAEQMMAALLSRVEQTREYQYCGIPIVNAVLSEKQAECENNGIVLQANLLFPENIAVEQIDLCSIFSNLLDNAIRACVELPPGNPHIITLHVGVQGDYLIVRCDNPAACASEAYPKGSGYGSRILKDIASRYDGSFQTEFHKGVFTARLVLLTSF